MSPYHLHWFVFDPVGQEPDEPVAGHLPSDLSEIYRDVRNGCNAWVPSDPATYRDALWQMHFDFMSHWGRHAVTALAAMHSLLHDTHIDALEDAYPAHAADEGALLRRQPPRLILWGGCAAAAASALAADARFVRPLPQGE